MRSGPNLLKLARKEQCLALLSQLRTKFKTDGQFYRVFPDGEVQYLHPKDGVYPEKVNQGRQAVGANDRSIGKNPNPISVSHLPAQSLPQIYKGPSLAHIPVLHAIRGWCAPDRAPECHMQSCFQSDDSEHRVNR